MNGILDQQDVATEMTSPAVRGSSPLNDAPPVPFAEPLPGHVSRRVLGGTSSLGLGMFIERGAGFLANILAARFAGASTFGAYSLGISTANQISTYAAGGIGATAARFSGKYQYGSRGYSTLARALAVVSVTSAVLAAAALWLGAGPIAHILGKPGLTSMLRWAVLSAAGIILLECCRGFFVGQGRYLALVVLSVIVGTGMITLLPTAALLHNPSRMLLLQGLTTVSAVACCLVFGSKLMLHAPRAESRSLPLPMAPVLREVWTFGFVQLAGLLASNLVGWWVLTLVARSDTTLVQMSFFAIASQLRNLVGIAPGLLTEGSYSVLADPGGEESKTPQRVMALCTYASLTVSAGLASLGIVLVPWGITLLYGKAYGAAGLTVALALAIAVAHMGNAPAAARLSIVSIRSTGIINTVWAIFVAVAAGLFLLHGGSAWRAMAIYFAGHVLSASLVLIVLKKKDHVPAGMIPMFLLVTASITTVAVLAWLRSIHPGRTPETTGVMLLVVACCMGGLLKLGRHFQWLPSAHRIHDLAAGLRARLPRRSRYV